MYAYLVVVSPPNQGWLQSVEEEVEYLFCTPTYAMRLIGTAKECGIPLQKNSLKKIIVAGECGGSQFLNRNKVDTEWGGESLAI